MTNHFRIENDKELWVNDDYVCNMNDYDMILRIINNKDELIQLQDDRIKDLETEKENWKMSYCSSNNMVNILMNELDYAQQAGYTPSDTYKEHIEKIANEFKEKYSDKEL